MKSIMTCLGLCFSLAPLAALATFPEPERSAQESFRDHHLLLLHSTPVSPEELERARGGFIAPGNIQIDIGFESILMIDGVLQSQSKLSMDNLTAGKLSNFSMGMINFVQGASGNGNLSPDTSSFLNQVIQNNMDNKLIQSIKVLDVELRNVGNLGQGPLQQMLHTQLIGALR